MEETVLGYVDSQFHISDGSFNVSLENVDYDRSYEDVYFGD